MQWLMLQQEQPEDFVIATGRQESVRRFIELTAQQLGWGLMQWDGEGIAEVGRRGDTGEVVVRIDPRYFRPAEVETLLGDPSKAKEMLGWTRRPPLRNSSLKWCHRRGSQERGLPQAQGLCCGGCTGMSLITTNDRFAIFGARGMAGSAISRALERAGYFQQLKPSRQELDLLDSQAVQQWFSEHQPGGDTCRCKSWRYSRQQHLSS